MEILSLKESPFFVGQLARWNFDEWTEWTRKSLEEVEQKYSFDAQTTYTFPHTVVAVQNDIPYGFASLRERDSHDWLPKHGPWICNVYVPLEHRGKSIATILCLDLINYAAKQGIKEVFLATEVAEDSLYHRLGFKNKLKASHNGVTAYILSKGVASSDLKLFT